MPLLTTCAVLGFKFLIKFAAQNLCDAVIPGSSELVGDVLDGAVDGVADKIQKRSNAPTPYWELGRAVCNGCTSAITRGCVSHCVTCGDFDLCASCIAQQMDTCPQFHDGSHMWTIYMISKTTRGYANLDNKPSLVTQPSAAGIGGQYHCAGYYMQSQTRTAMALRVVFSGRNGTTLSGRGHDAVGAFTIHGERQRNGSRIAFQKRYERHTVAYDGTLVDGVMLVGMWTIHRYDSGPFVLMLERADAAVEAVERAAWSGHYVQFRTRFSTSVELQIYASGRIEGRGHDAVGPFVIRGRFMDGITTGHFLFSKNYARHAISYEGVRHGSTMAGTYQSPGAGRDKFELYKVDE